MKFDQLEAFLVFSESLNFTHAAQKLHISQPALHIKIAKLSESIGKALYDKNGRSLFLTKAGEKLKAHARQQVLQTASFIEEIKTGEKNKHLSICAGEGIYQYLITNAVSSFITDYDAKLNVIIGDQDKTINQVLSGEAQIGITTTDHIPDNLQIEMFAEVGQVVVMEKSHELASKKTISLHDLNQKNLIVPTEDRPHRMMIDRLLSNLDIQWKAAIEVNKWELMLAFVKQGLGISIMNAYCHIPTELVAKPLNGFPKLRFYLIQSKNAYANEYIDTFRKVLFHHTTNWRRS